jgi:predicted RNase H-like HicB family nuclease
MLLEYIEAAMASAKFERLKDAQPYYGEIPALRGVWASGKSLEACRKRLREVLEGWILVRVKRGLPLPSIHGKRLTIPQAVRA